MPNKLFKKGLVVGIIVLFIFMGIQPVISVISVESKSFDLNENSSINDDLPDLMIDNVIIYYSTRGWPMAKIHINNLGGNVEWNLKCKLTMKKLFGNITIYKKTEDYGSQIEHPTDTIKTLTMYEFDMDKIPMIFFGKIYFEVDPDNKVIESNEKNNLVWTYVFCWWYQVLYGHMSAIFKIWSLRDIDTHNINP